MPSTLLWFRQDLRLQDNPALMAALARREAVIPVYVLDDAGDGVWPAGGASRWWLHHALASLDADLRARLLALGLAAGKQVRVLRRAGLSGPLHVRAGTTEIILRRSEASRIQVLRPEAVAA